MAGLHRANCGAARHDDVHVAARQFGHHPAQRIGIAGRVAKLKHYILSLDVTALAQSFSKSIHERVWLGFGRDPRDAMRFRPAVHARQRPCRHPTTNKRNELPPLHSITSSARERSVGAIVRLSTLAALRLMASSNLTGRSIGKSAGLAPFRTLST